MNIWLVSLFDPTPMDQSSVGRFIGIAQAAVARGHQVTHFTSTFRHTKKQHRFPESRTLRISEHYSVRYLHSRDYRSNMEPKRFIAHLDFARRLVADFADHPAPDLIFLSMPPISVGHQVSQWASQRGVPFIVDIIDPWPDSFIKDLPTWLNWAGKIAITPFASKLTYTLKRAAAVTGISREYVKWALAHLPAGAAPLNRYYYPAVDLAKIQAELAELPDERQDEKLRVIYAGSLASSYDLPCILRAADLLEERFPGQTEFVIAGTGPQQELVEKYADRLPNVSYLGWLHKPELLQQYQRSDLGLIQHMNSLTQTVTYKLFSYLSAGLPVLNSLQSEMVDIIADNDVGLNNQEGDYEQLAQNIEHYLHHPNELQRAKERALRLTAEQGDAPVVYDRLVQLLEDIAEPVLS
jgi:glycosyltransferase involved in cell wall biosynthesis